MREHIANFLKGFAIGAANVIPGVSGGTIALITGIFERLIDAIKAFGDPQTYKLLFKGKLKDFAKHTDLVFLIVLTVGAAVSILTLARLLDYLFTNYPVFIWSYFFGLIAASVYYVGKTIDRIDVWVVLSFIAGVAIAYGVTIIRPGQANDNIWYLMLCGVISISSMILPGISGSYVLILMGNYQLILQAINNLDMHILVPFAIGAGFGLLAFAHLLSLLYKRYKNQTIALLTGFILGSLSVLWPWKHSYDINHNFIPADRYGKLLTDAKAVFFENYLPKFDTTVVWAIVLAVLGVVTLVLIENWANRYKKADN